MLETAIIGGGLSGVALARALHRQGRDVALFEARPRLGGRILSVTCAKSGMALDLGPTWFWPETQPLITQLIAELGLVDFPQHDEGTVLHLRDPDKRPDLIEGKAFHNGARRAGGGMARLVDALAADLPSDHLHFDHVLTAVGRSRRSRRAHVSRGRSRGSHSARSRRGASCSPFRRGSCWNMSASSRSSTTRRRTPCAQPEPGWPAQAKVVIEL